MNNRKWSRIIAMLLAVMLVFCDSNVTYAVESMTEAHTEDPAAAQAAAEAEAARQAEEAQAAAEAEAARQAAEAQAAADAEAARQAAEAQAAADAEAARQAAEAQAAADAEAARQAAEAQAAADAEAARQAEEAQAAADAEAARQAEEAQATADTATADSETEPQTTPSATGSLTLKTEAVSTQKEGEAAKLKVTYELSADSSVNAVETRLYAWNKNAGYPQFKDGKFTDPETKREFQLKTDKDGLVYVEYILKKGESFTEEFEFIDTTLEVGTQITFDVAIGANGVVPANCSIQSTTAKVTYALPDGNGTATEVETESNAPESTAVENTVAFQSAEGASVTVDGADVTNGTAMAKDGKIVFTVTPAEGYEVTSILVDGTIPARTNDETPETNDYIIEGIQTDSTVVVISTQAVVVESETESETATEAATEVESESESETEAVTESESETVVETESETETIAETETESEAVTEAETEIETAAETETAVETESETEAVIETEAKSRKRKAKAKAKAAAQAGEGENGIAVPNGSVDLTDFLTSATIMTSDGKPYNPGDTMANNGWFILNLKFAESGTNQLPVYDPETGQTIVVYQMPKGIAKLDPSTNNQLKTEDKILVGEYDVETDGSIKIRFNKEINSSSTAKGWITVRAQFDRSNVETDKEFTIDFGGKAQVTVKLTDGGKLAANKSASAYDKETGTFTFTITLDADADVSDAVIADKLGSSLELVADSVELDGSKSGFTTDTTANPFKVTIPSLTKGEHKLTYKAKIKEDVLLNYNGEIPGLDNSAEITVDDKVISVKGDASYEHIWLNKSNNGVDKDTGKTTWTIVLNPEGDQPVAGLVIRDRLTGKLNYDKSQPIQVSPAINGKDTISWDEVTMGNDGKSWSYTMPDTAGKEAYTFTYATSAEEVDKKTDAYNTATVNGKFPSQSHVTLEPGTGDGTGKMTKTAGTVEPTEDGKYVPWEATLTIPKGTYKDGEITYTDTLYGTHEFAGTLSTNNADKYLKIEVTKEDGSSLDVKVTNQTKNSFQLSFPALTLKQAETVKIKYYSKVKENGTLSNVGELNSNGKLSSGSANTTVRDDKFQKDGSYDSKTDEITWTITVNKEGNSFTAGYVVIEDTLPSNQEYVDGSATWTKGDETTECYGVTKTDTGISINLGTIPATKDAIYVTYRTKTKAGVNRGETIKATNVAKIKINNKEAGSADTTVTIPSNVFDKVLLKDPDAWTDKDKKTKDYVAEFELIINEGNASLISGSEGAVYTVKDKMSSTMALDLSSVVVTNGAGEIIGKDVVAGPYYTITIQYNESEAVHEFTLEIHNPEAGNNHTYYVTYKANVQVGSGVGDVSWDNTADFSAGSVKKVSSQDGTVKKTQTTEGGITLGKTYIKIAKRDQNLNPLAGATFVLERYNETSQAWDKMQEVTTGADGFAYFGQTPEITTADPALQLDSGVKYRFQETKAPDGYLLNSEYYYFQIAGEKEFEDPQYQVKQLSSATAAFSILNIAKISVSATKSWNDAENQDGKRPTEITVTLKANGQDANVAAPDIVNGEVVSDTNNSQVKLKADASGSWANTKVTWNDLPKVDSNGQQITYTVEESWFSKEYSDSYQYSDKNVWGVKGQDRNVVITNTHTPEKTSVKFKKIWDDNSDQDGLRKEFGELYVALFADGTLVEKDADGNAVAPKQINKKSNTSEYSWDNLPKYKSGKEITYTIKEGTLTNGVFQEFTKESLENLGYTSKIDIAKTPIELTNTHESKTESLKVIKTWAGKDATKDDGNRPDSVTVNLQKSTDGKKWKDVANSAGVVATVTLNENNSWSYTWSKLPSYESGKKLSYQVVETVPSHYKVTYGKSVDNNGVSTITVTNTYKPTTINVEATKYWNDQNNKDGKRPEKIQFQLQKMEGTDGKWVNVGSPLTLTGTTDIWGTAKWTDLLIYENGKKISYQVIEVANEEITNDYSTNSPQTVPENGGTVTITNTRATSTKFQPVISKDLTGNRKLTEDGKKFSSGEFEFVLKDKDGKELQKKGIDADGKVTFDEIPYEKEGTYTYTISEVIPDDKNKVPGVEYSTAIVTMTVKVAPNKAGTKLEATASYTFSGNGAELKNGNVTFTNVYTAHGQASVTGKKNVKNITGNVPSFNFALYDANGKIVTYKDADGNTKECTASNDSKGNFSIQTPYYTQDDVKDSPYTYYL